MGVAWSKWGGLSSEHEVSKEWLLNPLLFEPFKEGRGISEYERDVVISIMNSNTEDEMIEKIAKISEKEYFYLQFPKHNIQSWQIDLNLPKFDKLTKEEIKTKLRQFNPWYYENEVKE